jgi:hypothetical protein
LNYYRERIAFYFSQAPEATLQILTVKGLKEYQEMTQAMRAAPPHSRLALSKDAPILLIQEVGDTDEKTQALLKSLGLQAGKIFTVSFNENFMNETAVLNHISSLVESYPKLGKAYSRQLKVYAGSHGKLDLLLTRLAGHVPDEWKSSIQIESLEVLRDLIENFLSVFRMQQSLKIAA